MPKTSPKQLRLFTDVPAKGTPVSGDLLLINDSADGNKTKRVTVGSLPGGGGGEANTASSAGGGLAVPYQKVGVDLEFYALWSANNRLNLGHNGVTKNIEFTFYESNVVHQNISGAGSATHANIDSHLGSSANPHGTDLENIGSGTLAELNAAITDADLDDASDPRNDPDAIHDNEANEFTFDAKETPVDDDYLMIEDSEDSGEKKKVKMKDLPSGGVGTSGTPVDNDFAKFTDASTIEGRSYTETRDDLNVATVDPTVNGFRLTPSSEDPVITGNVIAADYIFCSPYKSNRISLYDGSKWVSRETAEFSIEVTGRTTDLPCDVFCYDDSGTPTLEFNNWTDATNRATALTRQDGVLSKSGAVTRRYLATFRPRSATSYNMRMLSDGDANPVQIDLYNADNRVRHGFGLYDNGSSFTYSTATIRQWRADTGYQVEIINGLEEEILEGGVTAYTFCTGAADRSNGIGYDSTSSYVGLTTGEQAVGAIYGATAVNAWSHLRHRPGIGRHYYSWNQTSTPSGVTTWYPYVANQYRIGFVGSWPC